MSFSAAGTIAGESTTVAAMSEGEGAEAAAKPSEAVFELLLFEVRVRVPVIFSPAFPPHPLGTLRGPLGDPLSCSPASFPREDCGECGDFELVVPTGSGCCITALPWAVTTKPLRSSALPPARAIFTRCTAAKPERMMWSSNASASTSDTLPLEDELPIVRSHPQRSALLHVSTD